MLTTSTWLPNFLASYSAEHVFIELKSLEEKKKKQVKRVNATCLPVIVFNKQVFTEIYFPKQATCIPLARTLAALHMCQENKTSFYSVYWNVNSRCW